MDAYQHFGLSRPPFELVPDVQLFYETAMHSEALATLQYAVAARKGCCVVVGESGSGKTLLARIVAGSTNAKTSILWVRGCGVSADAAKVRVYPIGRFRHAGGAHASEETTLSAQTRAAQFLPEAPLLIVDSADELPLQGWRDVIGWLSNEICYSKAMTVLLFGAPRLLDLLAAPELSRLQRRVFRLCRLEPLSPETAEEYIRARIAFAGGVAERIFEDATINRLARLGRGNPALINQIGDNALLEAYGDGRDRVTTADVDNALRAVFGGCQVRIGALPQLPRARFALPHQASCGGTTAGDALRSGFAAQYPPPFAQTIVLEPSMAEDQGAAEARLRYLEARLSRTLSVVRDAQGQPAAGVAASGGRRFPLARTSPRAVNAEPATPVAEDGRTQIVDCDATVVDA
jgi:general secretion pathway protein A